MDTDIGIYGDNMTEEKKNTGTTVGIPSNMKKIIDVIVEKSPRFKNRTEFVHTVVWDALYSDEFKPMWENEK